MKRNRPVQLDLFSVPDNETETVTVMGQPETEPAPVDPDLITKTAQHCSMQRTPVKLLNRDEIMAIFANRAGWSQYACSECKCRFWTGSINLTIKNYKNKCSVCGHSITDTHIKVDESP